MNRIVNNADELHVGRMHSIYIGYPPHEFGAVDA